MTNIYRFPSSGEGGANRHSDPLLAGKFWLEIGGIAEGSFTECSGLTVETELEQVREGGLNRYVHLLPKGTKWTNIVLKRGFLGSNDLWDWYSKIVEGKFETRAVSIIAYENKGEGQVHGYYRWDLVRAFPVKWSGPQFQASGGAAAVETLEFAHSGWTGKKT